LHQDRQHHDWNKYFQPSSHLCSHPGGLRNTCRRICIGLFCGAPVGFAATLPIYLTARLLRVECNPGWRKPDRFADCSNFEQSLLKMMTRLKRWSTSIGSGWSQDPSLVVQVSGGALARTSSVAPSIKIKSKFPGK
jgi:hypothetical protein